MQRIAAIQLRGDGDRDHRLRRAAALIDEAAEAGAGLLVLPENFAYFGANPQQRQELDCPFAQQIDELRQMPDQAQKLRLQQRDQQQRGGNDHR